MQILHHTSYLYGQHDDTNVFDIFPVKSDLFNGFLQTEQKWWMHPHKLEIKMKPLMTAH